jgi:hypothetical protein
MRLWWLMVGVVVGVAAICAASNINSALARRGYASLQPACGKVLPPASGVYFGVMPGWAFAPATDDDVVAVADVAGFAESTSRSVAVAAWSISWHAGLPFPTTDVESLWRAGYVPQIRLVNWPTEDYAPSPQPTPPGPIPNSDIAAGKHDAELRRFADAARATDIPIEFDYDYEMQAAHPWGGRFDGGGTTTGYGDPNWPDGPEHYRDAYRHIIDIFRQEGATNVTFIFQTNTVDGGYLPGSYWEPWQQMHFYYPGDDYIDWLGLSVYSEPLFNVGPPQTFEHKMLGGSSTYQGSYAEITALGTKPLMINEMGLYRMPSEESKAQWVEDASTVLQSGEFARVKGIVWWAQNKGGDYDAYPRTSTFVNGFKKAFDQPFFDARAKFSGNCSPLALARVTIKHHTLSWTAVPNAASYEVWRGSKRIAAVTATSLRISKPGTYRIRGVNIVGFGPFATAHWLMQLTAASP